MKCECGCGKLTKLGKSKRFIQGHNLHTEESERKNLEARVGNRNYFGYRHTKEWKKNKSKWMTGRPGPNKGRVFSEEWIRNLCRSKKKQWADPVYHKKQSSRMARGNISRPNKKEIKLLELLSFLFPGDWKYVGDGSFIIAGKNPDFINVNGKKQIIELWGIYWHRGQNPEDRIAIFKPYGYKTLVIWEHELRSPRLIKKLNEFVEVTT